MLELSPRLQTIAKQVPKGAILADIGSDHGYLPVYLLKTGQIPFAIASDLREGPLSRGRAFARGFGLTEETIDFRCSDGLQGLGDTEVDTIVLAGMGGDTIIHCLEGVSWSGDPRLLYILQPMSAIAELRLWLSEHGFLIEREVLSREQEKRYVILRVRPGTMPNMSLGEIWAGRQESGQDAPERLAYLDDIIARRTRALEGMRQAKKPPLEEMNREMALLDELFRMKEEWIMWHR